MDSKNTRNIAGRNGIIVKNICENKIEVRIMHRSCTQN